MSIETINELAHDETNEPAYQLMRNLAVDPMKKKNQDEAAYLERIFKEQEGIDINHIENEEFNIKKAEYLKDYEAMGHIKAQQKRRAYRKSQLKKSVEQRQTGAWFKKYHVQGDHLEDDIDLTRTPAGAGKMLDDFIESRRGESAGNRDEDKDVDDDDDIY